MMPDNGADRLRTRAQQSADAELRVKMCKGEIEAALQKYGLIIAIRELRINGQMAEIGWMLAAPPSSKS